MKATGSDARFSKAIFLILAVCVFAAPRVSAQVVMSEIVYDLSGTDTGREWVEIANTGGSAVTIATSTWKFFEANTNHSLSLFQGSLSIQSGGFAVIADDPQKFLLDWPGFTGTIFDSVFSLSNSGETLALKSSATTVLDEVTYSSALGAAGDGSSLQKVGSAWQALLPTPGLASPSGASASATSSNQTSGSASSATATTSDTSAPAGASSAEDAAPAAASGGSSWPVEPQMFSRIVGPASAVAGADIVFKGEAVGADKQSVPNTRYLWNFGDGATKEGEAVLHAYNFPGEYVVILDASSGKFAGTSRWKIKVIPANVVIGEVGEGADGFVALINNAGQELDLSWWRIESGAQFFTLPKNTKILAHGRLPLSVAVLGFPVDVRNLALLYPNGVSAYRFEKVPPVAPLVPAAPSPREMPVTENVPAAVSKEGAAPKAAAPDSTVSVSSAMLAQTASVALAADRSSDADVPSAQRPARSGSALWFYGLGGVIILGAGFALYPRGNTLSPENPADKFNIIED